MLRSTGVRMAIGEEQGPTMPGTVAQHAVHVLHLSSVEGQVVEAGAAAVMTLGGERRGLLHHDVVVASSPAAADRPVLIRLVLYL